MKVGAAAAATGIGALAIATKIGIDEWSESSKVAAQTAAVLKSTGGAAHVTAGQVDQLATSILNKTGIDDEAIKSGENLLLTFRNIRNEAGKGNDIFNQATHAVTDMSVAMGEDMKSASIQVGKALNDPVKGITALTRVGVTFSDSQKTLIQRLVDTGRTADAQKVILRELNKEFGGSAEAAGKTLPGQLNILKEQFRNTAGEVAGAFVPILVKIAKVVFPAVGSAMQAVGKWINQFVSGFRNVGAHFSQAGQMGWKFSQILHGVVIPALHGIWAFIQRNVVPILKQLRSVFVQSMTQIGKVVQQHGAQIHRIMANVGSIIRSVAKVAIPILRFALVTVLPKAIGIALDATDAFTSSLKHIIDRAGQAKDAVQQMVNWIKTKVKNLAGPFHPLLSVISAIKNALEWINDHTIQIHIKAPSLPGAAGDILGAVLPQVGGVNALGDLLNHRAGGGPVSAMRPYIVGEHGPELYVPRAAGTIVPNGALAGGGVIENYVTVMLDGEPITARIKAEQRATERSLKAGKGWAPA